MFVRYLKVFKRKFVFFLIAVALIVVSTVTKGKTSTVFSTITGIFLIFVAIYYTIWIIKTPTKKVKDEAS